MYKCVICKAKVNTIYVYKGKRLCEDCNIKQK